MSGDAPSCQKSIEGSGFVYAPQHVMTNAHVVAGVPHPSVDVNGARTALPPPCFSIPGAMSPCSTCPGLRVGRWRSRRRSASAGDSAIVIGYPENGPVHCGFRANPRSHHRPRRRHLLAIHGGSRDLRHPRSGAARATPAARCSPRPVRSTAWFSLQPRTIRTPGYALTVRRGRLGRPGRSGGDGGGQHARLRLIVDRLGLHLRISGQLAC